MTGVVTDSEGEAPIIVSLSGKIGKRATTPITVSWGSVLSRGKEPGGDRGTT